LSQYITTTHGAASGLTDVERATLLALARDYVAHGLGVSARDAAAQLDQADDVRLVGDAERVAVTLHGRPLVAMTRASLREMARAA
jgi:hypothetical protein